MNELITFFCYRQKDYRVTSIANKRHSVSDHVFDLIFFAKYFIVGRVAIQKLFSVKVVDANDDDYDAFRKSIAQNIHDSIYFVKEWQRQVKLAKLNSGYMSNQYCLFHLGFRNEVFIPKVLNFRKSIAQKNSRLNLLSERMVETGRTYQIKFRPLFRIFCIPYAHHHNLSKLFSRKSKLFWMGPK